MTYKVIDDSNFKNKFYFALEMIKGYREMAKINIELANEALFAGNEASSAGEIFLSGCENNDSEKRRHLLC